MTDRFEEIANDAREERRVSGDYACLGPKEAEWLIAEVERLRRIEDAARRWVWDPNGTAVKIALNVALRDNPRPDSPS